MARRLIPALLLGLAVLGGCDTEKYPEDLRYPLRSDLVVTDEAVSELNKDDLPTHFDRPGQMPEFLGNLEPGKRQAVVARFKGENKILDPNRLSAEQRRQLGDELTRLFGTPAHPKAVLPDDATAQALRLDEGLLEKGSGVYRQHCLHCHGLTGDGRGPTGPWVNPHPRDYRRGIFKFTSSGESYGAQRKARREDLLRTLRNGIEGTSMPSFRLLADDELEALVSYVIHLSLRGETEQTWIFYTLKDPDSDQTVEGLLEVLAQRWLDTEKKALNPGPYPYQDQDLRASVLRGRDLFMMQGAAGCLSCHNDFGRQSTFKYDDWGTIVRPANLMLGTYRGGRRPIDLFWRIQAGVNGSAMPSSTSLTTEQVWDLVNFVRILPYPKMWKEYGVELD
jgi:mono/diheme cytochrome c family protein